MVQASRILVGRSRIECSPPWNRRTAKERRYGPQTGEDELDQDGAQLFDLDDEGYEPEEEDEDLEGDEIDFADYELEDGEDEDE